MSGENFIYFGAVSGFFVGIVFGVLKGFEPFDFLVVTLLMSGIFYLISLASVTFFTKYVDIKQMVYFNKHEIDAILENQIKELEKKEDFILESYEFIKKIEQEELDLIKSKKASK